MTNYFHRWVERSSIRQKIMVLLVVGIIGIGTLSFVVSFITLRHILTQRICETNQSTTEIMANRIDELFASSTTAVVGISIDQRIQENVGTLYSGSQVEVIHAMNTLKDLLSNYTYSIVNKPASIAMLTADGTLIYNGDSFSHPGNTFLQQVYADYMARFSLGSVPRRSPIKAYLPNPLSAQPADNVYCIAMPVRSPDAQYSALVLMLIRTQYMTPYLEVGDEEYHTRVLADETGKIVMSPDASLIGQDLSSFTHGSSLPQSGKSIRIDDSYLFCEKLDSFNGTVYDKMNTSDIDSQLWMVARRLLLLDLIAVVVMSA